jgi:hypothetical protein
VSIALAILFSGLGASFFGMAECTDPAEVDLAVSDIFWCDMFGETNTLLPAITSGQPYTICATVENIGRTDAGTFSTAMYLDGFPWGGVRAFDGLDAHASMIVSWTGIVTSDSGEHTALVSVNSEDPAADYDPANNDLEERFAVVEAEWTFAVYLDGDNNLEYYGILDFLEMALVGTTPEVNIVVQFDRAEDYYIDHGNWTDTKRFLITKGMEPWAESAYEGLGEANMGDGETLSDFASHAFDRFRSARTCLVLWDHGAGWWMGCCEDRLSNDWLTPTEMRGALTETTEVIGSPVDIVAFDACIMGSLEVACYFDGLAVDFVASIAAVLGTGFPYDAIVERLTADPSMGSEQLCEVMTSEYALEYIGYTIQSLSAFRVDNLCTSVKTALTAFADRLLELGRSYYGRIDSARDSTLGFDVITGAGTSTTTYSADLHMFAEEAVQRIHDDVFNTAAENLMKALEEARICLGVCTRDTFYDDILGLVVFWPDEPILLEEYRAELLSQDTTWDEFLLAYYSE